LDAVSYGASALLIASIRRPFRIEAVDQGEEPMLRRTIGDIREGLGFLWQHRLVRALTLLGFGVSFSGGAVTSLLVVYAVEGLGVPDEGREIGLLFSAGAAGTFVGTLLVPRLVRRMPAGTITLAALAVDFGLLLALAVCPVLAGSLPLYLAWSAAHMTIVLNGITLRQQVTPDRLQGRVNVTARMIAWGGTPFGAAAAGILAETLDVRVALALVAGGVGASAIAAWFTPLRGRLPDVELEAAST
jgi:MFS family permease